MGIMDQLFGRDEEPEDDGGQAINGKIGRRAGSGAVSLYAANRPARDD